jgi:hypothetical protein
MMAEKIIVSISMPIPPKNPVPRNTENARADRKKAMIEPIHGTDRPTACNIDDPTKANKLQKIPVLLAPMAAAAILTGNVTIASTTIAIII